MCSLEKLPDLALVVVLNKLDYVSIRVLRKVCHRFRDFIDQKPQKSKTTCDAVRVTVAAESVKLMFPHALGELTIIYQLCDGGCLLGWDNKSFDKIDTPPQGPKMNQKFLKKENYLDVFFKEFTCLVKFHDQKIDNLHLTFESARSNFLDHFENILTLKLSHFDLQLLDSNQLSSILTPIEARKISIDCWKFRRGETVEYGRYVELAAWKSAKELKISNGFIFAPISCFTHFRKLDFSLREVTTRDVIALKEAFLRDSLLEYHKLGFRNVDPSNSLNNILGPPLLFTPRFRMNRKMWFFRTDDPRKVLEIRLFRRWIDFQRVELMTIPPDVVVQV